MKKILLFISTLAILFILIISLTLADEGMWMLNQLDKLNWKNLKSKGLKLTPEQIYNVEKPALKDAIVWLGGCSAEFISKEGLILTNHHCSYGAIQANSSVEHDYLKDGFWAYSKDQELKTEMTANVLKEIRDVTKQVLAGVNDKMTPEERSKVINDSSRAIEKRAKGTEDITTRVADMFHTGKFCLFIMFPLRDIRLVGAPPSAIGNYGGETDNWMWPRHTGDFSLLRAYVGKDGKPATFSKDNIPYTPKQSLTISTKGVKNDDFAFIIGFPGRTLRYRTSYELDFAQNESNLMEVDWRKTRIDIMQKAMARDQATYIKLAGKIRNLENYYKYYVGQNQGLTRLQTLEEKRKNEAEFMKWLDGKPELKTKYGDVLPSIEKAYREFRTFSQMVFVSGQLLAPDMANLANRFRGFAETKAKATPEKPLTEKEIKSLKDYLPNFYKDLDLSSDQEIMTALWLKAMKLPEGQKFPTIQTVVPGKTGSSAEDAVRAYIDTIYKTSSLTSKEKAEKLIDSPADQIQNDPLVKMMISLWKDITASRDRTQKWAAGIEFQRGRWLEVYQMWKSNQFLYPDANSTMRFTFGQVKDYRPRDAVKYDYVTTFQGVVEKENQTDEFTIPPKLKELYTKKDYGRYTDKTRGDLVVNFLTTTDITGGNSGSAVMNGNGELIGTAFDGNWEAMTGDYVFDPQYKRTICVDVRYTLFIIDKFANAQNLIKEMDIR